MNRPDFITKNDWELLNQKYKNLSPIVKKIKNNYPIQYLIGNVNFYGYQIDVNKNVLIPRFETETLVEKTISYISKYNLVEGKMLEIGTGSGCISIALKKELPNLGVTAIDKSLRALMVAKKNAKKNHTEIVFIHRNMNKFKPVNKYNILISNPPYIAYDESVDPKVLYEPKKAIFARDEGLEYYKLIFKRFPKYMEDEFIMAFEIGEKQGPSLKKLAKEVYPKAKITIEKDLAGKNRYLFVIMNKK